MAARRPFWKWQRWKSIGFCLWPPSTCIWNLKLKFQSKLDLCSGNHVIYRQTDGRTDGRTDRRTDGRTRWIQYTPPPTSLGGGIITNILGYICIVTNKFEWHINFAGYTALKSTIISCRMSLIYVHAFVVFCFENGWHHWKWLMSANKM